MVRCFQRVSDYHMIGCFWAFESDLYDGKHATIQDYAGQISNTHTVKEMNP